VDKAVQEILDRHKENGSLVTILKEVQDRYSYLPQDAMLDIADALDVMPNDVYEVATFYSFLSTVPLGENVIRICKSTPCFLKNHDVIVKAVEKELDISVGEVTSDGKFSLHLTNCIGACDKAPAMMINKKTYGNLTSDKVKEILEEYK
jgi:NADH-quinone oxidoreductase E subunit